MAKKTLCELFESNKTDLQQTLTGMNLPKDIDEAQKAVTSYLETVFDSEGEFRQNLTQAEDYILEAAISLLNAQKKISSALTKDVSAIPIPKKSHVAINSQETVKPLQKKSDSRSILGAAGGAIAGKLIFGGWGVVFGSIAGVAISVYLSNNSQNQTKSDMVMAKQKTTIADTYETIDVDCFIGIVHDVCESVDNLINTFRAQVNRVVQKYESQDKPSLDKEYRPLLESIQSLTGYKRNHEITEEKYTIKLQERIEDLLEQLDNYDITLENYSEPHSSWFEKVPSPNTTEIKEVLPAVIKKGALVIPGKLFIPA